MISVPEGFKPAYCFFTALIQVSLGSTYILCVTREMLWPAIFVTFGFHIMWTFNVRAVVFEGWEARVAYALGASTAAGTILVAMKVVGS